MDHREKEGENADSEAQEAKSVAKMGARDSWGGLRKSRRKESHTYWAAMLRPGEGHCTHLCFHPPGGRRRSQKSRVHCQARVTDRERL